MPKTVVITPITMNSHTAQSIPPKVLKDAANKNHGNPLSKAGNLFQGTNQYKVTKIMIDIDDMTI